MEVVESKDKELAEAVYPATETPSKMPAGCRNLIPPQAKRRRSRQITMAGILYAQREAELAGCSPSTPFGWISAGSSSDHSVTTGAGPSKRKRRAEEEDDELLQSTPSAVLSARRRTQKSTATSRGTTRALSFEQLELNIGLVAPTKNGITEEDVTMMEKSLEITTKEKEGVQETEVMTVPLSAPKRFLLPDLNLPPSVDDQI